LTPPAIIVHTWGDEIVPFAHAEMIQDQGEATPCGFAGGTHWLETIHWPALFDRVRQVISGG